jgi:hypothetical protein
VQPADGCNAAAAASSSHCNAAYRDTIAVLCLLRLLLHARARHSVRHDRGKLQGVRSGVARCGGGQAATAHVGVMKENGRVRDVHAAEDGGYKRGGRAEVTMQPELKSAARGREHVCLDVDNLTAQPQSQLQQPQDMARRTFAALLLRPHGEQHMGKRARMGMSDRSARCLQRRFYIKFHSIMTFAIQIGPDLHAGATPYDRSIPT